MPLDKQVIDVPFSRGVNEKSDPAWVPIGEQTSVLNGRWQKNGSLRKRFGFKQISAALNAAPFPTIGAAVEAFRGGHTVIDGTSLYSYVPAASALTLQDLVPPCIATRTPIAEATTNIQQSDVASANGYALYVYRTPNSSGTLKNYATVVEIATGAQIQANFVLDTSTNSGLRAWSVGNYLWAAWTNSSGHIVGYYFDTTAGIVGWVGSSTLASDVSASASTAAFDVASVSGTTQFLMAYQGSDVAKPIKVVLFSSTGSAVTSTTFAPGGSGSVPIVGFAIAATTGETAWIAYSDTNGVSTTYVRSVGLDPSTLANVVADTAVFTLPNIATGHIGVVRVSSAFAIVIASGISLDVSWQKITTSATLVGPKKTQPGYQMWSKPFAGPSNEPYCLFYHYPDALARTFQLVDLGTGTDSSDTTARPVATVAPRAASIASSASVVSAASLGTGQFLTTVSVDIATSRVGLFGATFDFSSQLRYKSAQLGTSLYLSAGVPSAFDGAQVAEYGFLSEPIYGNTTVDSSGSNNAVDVGQHQYAVFYSWVNASGELQRSPAVYSQQIPTTAGNQTITLTVQPYTMTTKQDLANGFSPAVMFDVYRNTILDPSTFFKVRLDSALVASLPTMTSAVSIVDDISDATLGDNAYGLLYTLGGVLDDQCPPSLTNVTLHKNRIFGVGEDGLTLWFTKQYVTGFTPGFNDQLTLPVPEDGGVITGLASLDDHLVVFKADRIFALYGSGPNVTGQQSDFSDFVRLASDTGCSQPRSVVVAPAGVFFQSAQGLYLLSRGGETVYIGKPVEDTVAANPVCFASDIVAADGEIRWTLGASLQAIEGLVVSYDYSQDAWSVHKYNSGGIQQLAARGAACSNGTWAWSGPSGEFYVQTSDSFRDGTTWVPLQVETAWVKANGIAGWGRFWRGTLSMRQSSPFQITLEVATNLSDTYGQTLTFTDAQIAAWTTPMPICSVLIGDQRTEAIRFRFTDNEPVTEAVGTGEGPILLGANCEVGIKPGSKGTRIAAAQRG